MAGQKRRKRIVIEGKTEVTEIKPAHNGHQKKEGGPIEKLRFGYYRYERYAPGAGHVFPAHKSA